jgi:alpha-glucosidase
MLQRTLPASTIEVLSPNAQNKIVFELDKQGSPSIGVEHIGKEILNCTSLGMSLAEGTELGDDLEIVSISDPRDVSERYDLVAGKHNQAESRGTERVISLRQRSGRKLKFELHVRSYDDGIAFRYIFPKQPGLETIRIRQERTALTFADDYQCWPGLFEGFVHSNEAVYNPTRLSKIDSAKLISVPVTMRTADGVVLCLTEANLTDFAGAFFQRHSTQPHTLQVELCPHLDEPEACVVAETPLASPWRVLIIGDDLGVLFDTDLVTSLSEPSRIAETSWIRPGKVVFPWWPNFKLDDPAIPSVNCFENAKAYIDFAAKMGIEYLELEPPWYGPEQDSILHPDKYDVTQPLPEMRLPELLEYAKQKGVGIFLWVHWKSLYNNEQALETFAQWGAKGVKIDYLDRTDQWMVGEYARVLEEAAKHKLVVFFHGAYPPRGIRRTWPNCLTREGVMGNEYNKWSSGITATHNVTLPFTRMVVGPMDYTPGGFRNVTPAAFNEDFDLPQVMSTRCQQLAMFVVYESPLQMICDYPGAYEGQPGTEFLRYVPATWDETRFIAGEIGSYVVLARRAGDIWYLGAMTNETGREIEVPLEFLGNVTCEGELWLDGANAESEPKQIQKLNKICQANDTLHLPLAASGGAVVRFVPQSHAVSGVATPKLLQ